MKDPSKIIEAQSLLLAQLYEEQSLSIYQNKVDQCTLAAVALYSLFDQPSKTVYKKDLSLAEALGLICGKNKDQEEKVRDRLTQLFRQNSFAGRISQLRGLISLLKREDQPFDYSWLAQDLYKMTDRYKLSDLHYQWLNLFYRGIDKNSKTKKEDHND